MRERAPIRIVLVGYGPVGARFVDELLPSVRSGAVSLTVVGAEADSAYNRVLLAEYAVGRAERSQLDLADATSIEEAGVRLLLSSTVATLNRSRQGVTLDTGEYIPYDRLVLATGARANIPTLVGLETPTLGAKEHLDHTAANLPIGVRVMRDLGDADAAREAVERRAHIVVLGAGVLGMEFALAAREQGSAVTVVYHDDGPMERNLDRGGGRTLAAAARRAGVEMLAHSRAESVLLHLRDDGKSVFQAVICADGKHVPGDMLVLSCGVGARMELARRAGLATARGVLVDEELRSWTDPDIFAIGDCAQVVARVDGDSDGPVHGAPSGLIGPGWRQADWLAAAFAAEARGARRADLLSAERRHVVMLKSEGVHVVSAGDISAEPWDEEPGEGAREVAQWADPARGRYVKTVTRDGVLEGFVCAGMPRAGSELTLLFERGSRVPADPSVLLTLDTGGELAMSAAELSHDDTVCWCNGVTAGAISGCSESTVEGVGRVTRAGTGCGGCKGKIAQLLAQSVKPEAQPVV